MLDSKGDPVAVSSVFGWVVSSAIDGLGSADSTQALHTIVEVDNFLRNFWEIEEPCQTQLMDSDDITLEEHLRTHTRHTDGKYIVELPFKMEAPRFAEALSGAVSRFHAVELRLQKNESLGEKLRVVFDGSFADSRGVVINSVVHIGPSIQRNLFSVCLRFRMHRYVFRQIWVAEHHRNYQRIVWRESLADPIRHFQLCTVTYGTACAPYLSVRVLQQLAEDYKHQFPRARSIVRDDFYVDDILTGADSKQELIEKLMRSL
ncbi:uncharacterized protein LOC118736109 [Rhagoletis pomonella]|uniref:uncharacterized protein LOC118736109 n=1 Tax=Rhagoletis pomonella TaxID=28610 RepID=UPI0017851001|nr:uncharacterized protein LOC118736109 [Rhagoletis pomonella]